MAVKTWKTKTYPFQNNCRVERPNDSGFANVFNNYFAVIKISTNRLIFLSKQSPNDKSMFLYPTAVQQTQKTIVERLYSSILNLSN